MTKVDISQIDYLQHAEELAQSAQSWETKQKSLGRETVNAVRGRSNQRQKKLSCYACGRVGHQ
ncbi:hypothetical protein PF010_g10177 [Phytophthora fragariae]|uniref:Uncharacterized protein n=1 Tax=Phytophthora fragariae TaxID=53985 RepID=A0A6G0LAB4_9STRA|nr:hypothetical protein PF010_g10177 [Phytophthora fragariae]KAE9342850.1 hypothetical protein PF008_g9972 [Phytophthora fragariae]